MIIIKKLILFAFVFILCACAAFPCTAISAQSVIAVKSDSFASYYESNGYERREIASVTKVMTAVLALELCEDTSETITVPDEAIGVEGTSIYLKSGEMMTVDDLIWAVLLNSANDASVALAVHIAGSVDAFVELMNMKAKALCMNDTVYKTPNGLPAEGQYSTAHDQALLACYALSVDGFVEICSSYTHNIPYDGVEDGRYLVNHNRLIKSYDGCIGMKTGYTKSAGRCLVTCAERDGVTLVCVTLNDPNDWADHKTILDKGFKSFVTDDKIMEQ